MTSPTDLFLTLTRLSAAIKEVEAAITRLDIAAPVKTESKPRPRPNPAKPVTPDTKAVNRPALRVGQIWLKRDGETTSISLRTDRQRGKNDHFFTSSEGVEYAPSGFHQPGKFSRLDLVKLVQDAPDDETAEPVQPADPAPDAPASSGPAAKPKKARREPPSLVVAQDIAGDIAAMHGQPATPAAEPTEHAAVMLESFTRASKYMLRRALVQFCRMTEVQAKSLIEMWPNRPVEVARYISPIHAQNTINGLTRVKGVRASIKMVTIK